MLGRGSDVQGEEDLEQLRHGFQVVVVSESLAECQAQKGHVHIQERSL